MLLSILALAAPTWLPPTCTPASATPEIDWMSGRLSRALSRSRVEKKPVFVYFWTSSSQQCKRTWNESITSVSGQKALEEFVCFSAQVGTEETTGLIQEFNVSSLPTMLVLNQFGEPEDALLGYHSESLLVSDLTRILQGTDTVSDRRKLSDAAPYDLGLRFSLAAKLDHVGSKQESQELYNSIRRDDASGTTVVGAQLQLWDVMKAISTIASDAGDMATYDLDPIYDHMPRVIPNSVAFEGWEWITRAERARGDLPKVWHAMRMTWPNVTGDGQTLNWGMRTAWYHWENRDTLTTVEKTFALEVALRCADIARAEESQIDADGGEREERDYEALDVLAVCYLLNAKSADALQTAELSLEKNGSTPEREQILELCRVGKP